MTETVDYYLNRLGGLGYVHVEAEVFVARHAAVFIWKPFDRAHGRAFGGVTLEEALSKAVGWAATEKS